MGYRGHQVRSSRAMPCRPSQAGRALLRRAACRRSPPAVGGAHRGAFHSRLPSRPPSPLTIRFETGLQPVTERALMPLTVRSWMRRSLTLCDRDLLVLAMGGVATLCAAWLASGSSGPAGSVASAHRGSARTARRGSASAAITGTCGRTDPPLTSTAPLAALRRTRSGPATGSS